MHSKVYENSFYSDEFIKQFLDSHSSITIFSKEDFLELQKNSFYGVKFDTLILSNHVDYLVNLLSKEELLDYLVSSYSVLLHKKVLEYLVQHFELYDEVIDKFLDFYNAIPYILFFFPMLYQLIQKNTKYLKYFTLSTCHSYLCNDHFLVVEEPVFYWMINDKEKMKYFLDHIPKASRKELLVILRKLIGSSCFLEIYQQKKTEIYLKFLLEDNFDKFSFQEHFPILMILEDLFHREHMDLYDLKFLSSGGFCDVFLLKNYILKVGQSHTHYEIIHSSSLLYPMVRKQIDELDFYIEVENICETRGINFSDVYQIYKEEREKGNIWFDAKIQNVGRLLKDNGTYGFDVSPSSIGFIGENESFKKAGEVVILDLDLLFKESEIDWEAVQYTVHLGMYRRMEKRYQEEMKLERKI